MEANEWHVLCIMLLVIKSQHDLVDACRSLSAVCLAKSLLRRPRWLNELEITNLILCEENGQLGAWYIQIPSLVVRVSLDLSNHFQLVSLVGVFPAIVVQPVAESQLDGLKLVLSIVSIVFSRPEHHVIVEQTWLVTLDQLWQVRVKSVVPLMVTCHASN